MLVKGRLVVFRMRSSAYRKKCVNGFHPLLLLSRPLTTNENGSGLVVLGALREYSEYLLRRRSQLDTSFLARYARLRVLQEFSNTRLLMKLSVCIRIILTIET